jgi:hypothetical protein
MQSHSRQREPAHSHSGGQPRCRRCSSREGHMLGSVGGRRAAGGGVPGGIRRRHMGRHCGCRGRRLLVLIYCQLLHKAQRMHIHLLKLVTGVETSTRPARSSGKAGKTVNRRSRTAAAAPKSSAFCCVSMAISARCYRIIGAISVLRASRHGVRCMVDPCRANAVPLSASPRHLELFCAKLRPTAPPTVSRIAAITTMANRSKKKGTYSQ